MRVLLTGATGFVGRALSQQLARVGYRVRAALRRAQELPPGVSEACVVGDFQGSSDWTEALREVDMVVHAAARAHQMGPAGADPHFYWESNVAATRTLAEAAVRNGVRRFLYVSSIKVNGEETTGKPMSAADPASPQDAYGRSKWLGEEALREVTTQGTMEPVIIRTPLVYGPGVRANFLRLMRWVDGEWPLPLGAVHNSRSLISLWNLCDLICVALGHARSGGHTWMASDGEDLSTPDLIRRLASAMGRRSRLLPVPLALLRMMAGAAGRGAELNRLCSSLVVDIASTRAMLEWKPPLTVDEGLAGTVAWYLREGRVLAS